MPATSFEATWELRRRMVARLEEDGTLRDPHVIDAILAVPREEFLEGAERSAAYEDRPLSIGANQTISAPHMVAIMCEALDLQPGQRVMEIGTGTGYHGAVTAHLVGPRGHVTTIEWREELAQKARRNYARLGLTNIDARPGDGGKGARDGAPFDRIYLTCATPLIPAPLYEQAAPGGLILAPVGEGPSRLIRQRREGGKWATEDLGPCAFVPLRGEFGLR